MSKSILQNDKYCYVCGKLTDLQDHHIYFGSKRRTSERNGFKAWLCITHHTENKTGVHSNRELDLTLKRHCQTVYEKNHSREDFMKLTGRNYLP